MNDQRVPQAEPSPRRPASECNRLHAEAQSSVFTDHASLRTRARDLVERAEQTYVELARVLHEIHNTRAYLSWDFTTFDDYVRQELGWERRKGRNFVEMVERIVVEAGVCPEELAKIPWSAAAVISSLPAAERTPERIGGWLDRARTGPVATLRAEVKGARAGAANRDGKGPEKFEPFSVRLAPRQLETVNLALNIAQTMTGSDKKCNLLSLICSDFIAGRHKEVGLKLDAILRHLEDAFEHEFLAFRVKGAGRECTYASKGMRKHIEGPKE